MVVPCRVVLRRANRVVGASSGARLPMHLRARNKQARADGRSGRLAGNGAEHPADRTERLSGPSISSWPAERTDALLPVVDRSRFRPTAQPAGGFTRMRLPPLDNSSAPEKSGFVGF